MEKREIRRKTTTSKLATAVVAVSSQLISTRMCHHLELLYSKWLHPHHRIVLVLASKDCLRVEPALNQPNRSQAHNGPTVAPNGKVFIAERRRTSILRPLFFLLYTIKVRPKR